MEGSQFTRQLLCFVYCKQRAGGSAADSIDLEVRDFSIIDTGQLEAYYPFNGNANDASGNNNNGVNFNATLTSDRFANANSGLFL